MTRKSPVGKIQRLYNQGKYVAVVRSVRLWDNGHDGYLWFYLSDFINILPGSRNINTTFKTPDWELVLVIVSRYGFLIDVDNNWLTSGVYMICCVSPETFPKRSGE